MAVEVQAGKVFRGGASLLFGQPSSQYVVQRMSVADGDAGTLLQRYSMPDRLADCSFTGVDIGVQSSNIYVLLSCLLKTLTPLWETYSLVCDVAVRTCGVGIAVTTLGL